MLEHMALHSAEREVLDDAHGKSRVRQREALGREKDVVALVVVGVGWRRGHLGREGQEEGEDGKERGKTSAEVDALWVPGDRLLNGVSRCGGYTSSTQRRGRGRVLCAGL